MKEGRDITAEPAVSRHLRGCKWYGLRCPNEVYDHGCAPDVGCDWCRCACRTVAVTIDRAVLAEALEQIERLEMDRYDDIRGNSVAYCMTCNSEDDLSGEIQHKPDCRYVRVVDALKKAMGM